MLINGLEDLIFTGLVLLSPCGVLAKIVAPGGRKTPADAAKDRAKMMKATAKKRKKIQKQQRKSGEGKSNIADMLDDFTANNSESLQILLREFDTEVLPLPEDVMDALYESSQAAIQSLVESDPMAKKIAASYFDFAQKVRTYHEISERGYLNARDRLLPPVSLTAESVE